MGHLRTSFGLFMVVCTALSLSPNAHGAISPTEKKELRAQVLEMFQHGFGNYMEHAYPADELMPLSCRGRHRGTKPSRGDIDDSLGNFSLTLVDTLDTLVVLGLFDEFEDAVRKVIQQVTFDRDIVVSVFETNIRMLGGLLGGHVMADLLKRKKGRMHWYNGELLEKAKDLGDRLLPAFNTTTGMPYPRVNLRYGIRAEGGSRAGGGGGQERDTCTACAGTMILEFAALSRLTGEPLYEARAHNALEYLWRSRHRSSNLVGTVINIHNGEWVRRESGIGAGIDSYYEYLLKAYILLGDDTYLERFNMHYEAISKYISQGPLMLDVHMHRPLSNSRNFMDALLAFWPGLQVLKGDLKPAIEIHEMLYQVTQRHNFLPEAFTTDFRVHWGQHPLRPEFVESTYFLYGATGDPHYLDVGKTILENLNKHARVPCGFAAIKDVTSGVHEDQMDSFVLAETFKYLFLLFSEKEEVPINVDDYIFTTEAHLLPLTLSMKEVPQMNVTKTMPQFNYAVDDTTYERSCPNSNEIFPSSFVENVRSPLKNMVENLCPKPKGRCAFDLHVEPPPVAVMAAIASYLAEIWTYVTKIALNTVAQSPLFCMLLLYTAYSEMFYFRRKPRLRASSFIAGDVKQLDQLTKMGIRIVTMTDGRVQLLHTAADASSENDADDGMLFMQEMIELSKAQVQESQQEPRVVQLLGPPPHNMVLHAGPAQFGLDLKSQPGVEAEVVLADPLRGCQPLRTPDLLSGKLVVVERGDCMFVDKARHLQAAGASGGIVIDNIVDPSDTSPPLFAMSGDGKDDVSIPLVFLFRAEYTHLQNAMASAPGLMVYIGYSQMAPGAEPLTAPPPPAATPSTTSPPHPLKPPPSGPTAAKLESDPRASPKDDFSTMSMTYHTASGLPLFTVSQDTHKQLHLTVDKTTIKQAGKARMASALEQVVQLIQSDPNFGKMNLREQSDYLFTLGKLMETSFTSTDSQAEFEKKILDILEEKMPRKSPSKPQGVGPRMDGDITGVLDEYINQQIGKVFEEARSFLKNVDEEGKPATPDANAKITGSSNEEESSEIQRNAQSKDSVTSLFEDNLDSYATEEDLSEEDLNSESRSTKQVIQKAPEWLHLDEGEVFITAEGVIFTNEGYECSDEDSGIDEEEDEIRARTESSSLDDSVTDTYLEQVRLAAHPHITTLDLDGLVDLEPEIFGAEVGGDSNNKQEDGGDLDDDEEVLTTYAPQPSVLDTQTKLKGVVEETGTEQLGSQSQSQQTTVIKESSSSSSSSSSNSRRSTRGQSETPHGEDRTDGL